MSKILTWETSMLFICSHICQNINIGRCTRNKDTTCNTYTVQCRAYCWQYCFYCATQLCQRGLGSRNSVRPSVRFSVGLSHACFVTNPKNLPAIFLYHMKGQSFQFSAIQQWLVGDVPFHLKWAIEVTHPSSKIAHVDRFPPVMSQQSELAK